MLNGGIGGKTPNGKRDGQCCTTTPAEPRESGRMRSRRTGRLHPTTLLLGLELGLLPLQFSPPRVASRLESTEPDSDLLQYQPWDTDT